MVAVDFPADRMTLSDYTDAARFPATTQRGLSAKDQLRIDAFNYDQLTEYIDMGGELSEKQKAAWRELTEKIPHLARLTREVREAEKRTGG
jgi:hypothetical protein